MYLVTASWELYMMWIRDGYWLPDVSINGAVPQGWPVHEFSSVHWSRRHFSEANTRSVGRRARPIADAEPPADTASLSALVKCAPNPAVVSGRADDNQTTAFLPLRIMAGNHRSSRPNPPSERGQGQPRAFAATPSITVDVTIDNLSVGSSRRSRETSREYWV